MKSFFTYITILVLSVVAIAQVRSALKPGTTEWCLAQTQLHRSHADCVKNFGADSILHQLATHCGSSYYNASVSQLEHLADSSSDIEMGLASVDLNDPKDKASALKARCDSVKRAENILICKKNGKASYYNNALKKVSTKDCDIVLTYNQSAYCLSKGVAKGYTNYTLVEGHSFTDKGEDSSCVLGVVQDSVPTAAQPPAPAAQ